MMPEDILRLKSINQFHELVGFDIPKHPLISVIELMKKPYIISKLVNRKL